MIALAVRTAAAVGATAGQVRRVVLGEVLIVGIAATLPGGLTGALIAAPLARWLARHSLAPAGLTALSRLAGVLLRRRPADLAGGC
jgi:hypothetical protein